MPSINDPVPGMKGQPTSAQFARGKEIEEVLARALEGCTCEVELREYDADGSPALAILHDSWCARLREQKARQS